MSETNHTRSHEEISTDPITDPVEALRRWHDGTFALSVEDVGRAVGEVLSKLDTIERARAEEIRLRQLGDEDRADELQSLQSRLDKVLGKVRDAQTLLGYVYPEQKVEWQTLNEARAHLAECVVETPSPKERTDFQKFVDDEMPGLVAEFQKRQSE